MLIKKITKTMGGWILKIFGSETPYEIHCDGSSQVNIGRNVFLLDSVLTASDDSVITIEDDVKITGYKIGVSGGRLRIGPGSILRQAEHYKPEIIIMNGQVDIDHHSLINANILVRFNGALKVGCYTAINQGTMIRCDESIHIGDYVMISYECRIFDTNTHQKLPPPIRRSRTTADFPSIGNEVEKPETSPVWIGDDVWIGERAAIIKGARVDNQATIGLGSVVAGYVPVAHTAIGNPARLISPETK